MPTARSRSAPRRDAPASERLPAILRRLRRAHPDAAIELRFSNPLECVVATVLSAQSTDATVNVVTERLFRKYRKPEDYLAAPEEELQRDIHATGFFRQKTKALRGLSQKLLEDYGGEVPARIAELITLPGVARKTANVVMSALSPEGHVADPDAGIAVDTHVKRRSRRFGFTREDDPAKIERDLMRLIPRTQWGVASFVIILHGRRVCDALRPRCGDCVVEDLCPSSLVAGCRDKAGQAKGLG